MKLKHLFRNKKLYELEDKIIFLEAKLNNLPYELCNLKNIKYPNIKNRDDTLKAMINNSYSLSRFGDGEFTIMFKNKGPYFQPYSLDLAKKLIKVFNSNLKNLKIGINHQFVSLNEYTEKSQKFWLNYFAENRDVIYKNLDFKKEYFDSFFSRPYIDFKDKSHACEYFLNMKKIWQNKNIIIVEGDRTRLGVGNDLFDNAKSIERIICPAENAFSKYNEILTNCQYENISKLFLLALGPTASVLAYDLTILGYRAIDIGHIDIEYEWFLSRATQKVAIKDKYVNEKSNGRTYCDCKDTNYNKQIKIRI